MKQRLEQVAQQYRENGYDVYIRPHGAQLPAFLRDFEPDMIARSKSESAVVAVKSRSDLATDHQLSYLAALVNAQPGWRFDLVVTNPRTWPDPVSSGSTERDLPEIQSLAQRAQGLITLGELEAASLVAWSAVEAAMREVTRKLGIVLQRKHPQLVLKTLYSQGVLSHAEYEQLQDAMRIRNAVAHGLKSDKLQPQLPTFLVEATHRLLDYQPSAQS